MASIKSRIPDDDVRSHLRVGAAGRGRSMYGETRLVLSDADGMAAIPERDLATAIHEPLKPYRHHFRTVGKLRRVWWAELLHHSALRAGQLTIRRRAASRVASETRQNGILNCQRPPSRFEGTPLTILFANNTVGNKIVGNEFRMLRKGGGNWVEGDRFFNREIELAALEERVQDGTHTLLTAQRRMGKTSLVRQITEQGEFETVFVDLEAAIDPADAIAEIAVQAKPLQGAWLGIKSGFASTVQMVGDRIEELSLYDLKVTLRAGIDAGNWRQRGALRLGRKRPAGCARH